MDVTHICRGQPNAIAWRWHNGFPIPNSQTPITPRNHSQTQTVVNAMCQTAVRTALKIPVRLCSQCRLPLIIQFPAISKVQWSAGWQGNVVHVRKWDIIIQNSLTRIANELKEHVTEDLPNRALFGRKHLPVTWPVYAWENTLLTFSKYTLSESVH